jgi:hypothetical protein
VTWTNQRLVTLAPADCTFAWAPECTYDATAGKYRLYFASDPGGIHKMYTTTTSDFVNVAAATLFYDPGSGLYAIDGTIIPYNGVNYMFFKYSDPGPVGAGIQRVQSSSLAGPWTGRSGALTDNDVEGPTVFKDNNANKWYLYYDYYTAGYWGCSTTTNPAGSWTKLAAADVSLPSDVRHGNMIPVTTTELNRLIAKYGTTGPTPAPVVTRGDVNGDGKIDIVDALMIAQRSVGLNPAGFVSANADVNCSGTIDIVDALMTAQRYVGLIAAFPC